MYTFSRYTYYARMRGTTSFEIESLVCEYNGVRVQSSMKLVQIYFSSSSSTYNCNCRFPGLAAGRKSDAVEKVEIPRFARQQNQRFEEESVQGFA